MIPKIIHFFWEGKKMSWMRYMTIFSFRKYNPDWKIILHTPSETEEKQYTWNGNAEFKGYWDLEKNTWVKFDIEDYYSKIGALDVEIKHWDMTEIVNKEHAKLAKALCKKYTISPIQKSDFFSWDILSTVGGIYSDMDVLFCKPMESFYKEVYKHEALICYYNNMFPIGFLGSSPNSKLYSDILYQSLVNFSPSVNESAGTEAFYKLLLKINNECHDRSEKIQKKYPNTHNIDRNVCYPWDCFSTKEIFLSNYQKLPEKTIAIHWYAGDNLAQKNNSFLTESNFQKYNNTFCNFSSEAYGIPMPEQNNSPTIFVEDLDLRTKEDEWFYYKNKYPQVSWNYETDKHGLLVVCEPILEVPQNWDSSALSNFHTVITFNRKFAEMQKGLKQKPSPDMGKKLRSTIFRHSGRYNPRTIDFITVKGVPCFNQYWELNKHLKYSEKIHGIVCLNKCEDSKRHASDIYYLRKQTMESIKSTNLVKHVYARNKWGGDMYQGNIPYFHSHLENLKVINKYKFCLCFESTYDPLWSWDFLTERIFNCFKAKTIPIYYGCYNVEEWIPKKLFIDFREYIGSVDKLSELLESFNENKFTEMTEEAYAWNKTHRIGNVQDLEELVRKHI